MEQEIKLAEQLHRELSQELKSEDELINEAWRYKLHIEAINNRKQAKDESISIIKEATQKHIEWAQQENEERAMGR